MRVREHDSRRLDVERFAIENGQLHGEWPLAGMQRVAATCHESHPPAATDRVTWRASGETRKRGAGEVQTWLRLVLGASLELTCQRCLGPVRTPLTIDRWFRFVASETQAAEIDAECEEDVLVSTRSLDLHELAEDELLLALPIVPRHEVCPRPLVPQSAADAPPAIEAGPTESPFAVLAALKRGVH